MYFLPPHVNTDTAIIYSVARPTQPPTSPNASPLEVQYSTRQDLRLRLLVCSSFLSIRVASASFIGLLGAPSWPSIEGFCPFPPNYFASSYLLGPSQVLDMSIRLLDQSKVARRIVFGPVRLEGRENLHSEVYRATLRLFRMRGQEINRYGYA